MTNSERKDYYEILGVDPSTNIKLIKNIYLQLVHKYQEEGDESPEAQEKLKLIEEAYEVLSDPQKRLEYESPGQVYTPGTAEQSPKGSPAGRSIAQRSKRTLARGARPPTPQGISSKIWIPVIIIIIVAAGAAAVFFLDPFAKDEVEEEPVVEPSTPIVTIPKPTHSAPKSFYDSGKELLAQGNYSEAIEAFNEAINRGIENAEIYECRGDAYFGEGEYDLAIVDYSTSMALGDSKPVDLFKKRGIAYAMINDYELAIQDDSNAIELSPDDAEVYYYRGFHYFSSIKVMDPSTYKSDHAQLALSDFDTAIELDPSVAKYYYSRGLVHTLYRLYDLAIADFTEAVQLDPTFKDAYWERANIYLNMEQYQLAVGDFDTIVELEPDSTDVIYWRGHVYHLLKQYDLAIADFNVVLDHDATVEVQSERGFCYLEKGDITMAIQDFDMCTIYYPAFADAWRGRALAYHHLGDNAKAIEDMQRYISLVRHDSGLVAQARQLIEDWKR